MSIEKDLYRRVAGSFASGVTVVSTGTLGNYHGMTASAFTSLSLNPTLVLVCIDRAATTLPILQRTGSFAVNILAAEQQDLSTAFATHGSPTSNGLHEVDYRIGELGVPLLNGALAFLECHLFAEHDGGDHVIVVGEVMQAGIEEDKQPLLYSRGRYRRLANG